MDLTLGKVQRLMSSTLGNDAITLQNYVHRVAEAKGVSGVILGADGVLYYDKEWWDNNIDTPEKAKHVILFEIMKKLLGADRRGSDWVARVATGAVINSFLYAKYSFHELPRAMYSAVNVPEFLMRPHARGYPSRLKRLYRGIWDREERFTSIPNVEKAMRVLFKDPTLMKGSAGGVGTPGNGGSPEDIDVPGYLHGGDNSGQFKNDIKHQINDQLPSDVLEHMAEGISKTAGYSETMQDEVMEKVKSRKTLETRLIEEFAMDKIKKKLRKHFGGYQYEDSPIPLKLSQRDAFKLAMGWIPMQFQTEVEITEGDGGIAFYMDVSGSYYSYIPYTMGLVESLGDLITHVYAFSNQIDEIDMQRVKNSNKVRFATTGGTDFDCVLKHAVDNKFESVVIITDGWADVNNEEIRALAEKHVKKVFVIIVSRLPGGTEAAEVYADDDEPDGVVGGFLKNTWIGQKYKRCVDLSVAFK